MLGPDNGVLPLTAGARVVALEPARLGVGAISATFHGRDVFAPAAALLADGQLLETLGAVTERWIELTLPSPLRSPAAVSGEIIQIDRFGNLLTNLSRIDLGTRPLIRLGDGRAVPLVNTYADAEPGSPVALIGSSELLEIAVRDASAQVALGARLGDPVTIEQAVQRS
jgi:S-adenosylmethionine hydrolase